MCQNIFATTFVLLASLASRSESLGLDGVGVEPCFEIKRTAPVDLNWLSSQKKMYYPLMSILDLYSMSQEILQNDFRELIQPNTIFDSCVELTMGEDTVDVRGFQGRGTKFTWKPTPDFQKYDFNFKYAGLSGTCYTTLTDNSTFIFVACCTSDNRMTWAVGSTVKSLPSETVSAIHDHAAGLGFRRDFFTQLRYSTCDVGKIPGLPGIGSIPAPVPPICTSSWWCPGKGKK